MSVNHFILLLIGGLLIVGILVLLWHPQRSQTNADTSADRQRTDSISRDDDRIWRGGIFYDNPDDPQLFVPKRFGLGWTVNFGHPLGMWVLIVMLVLPLVLSILTVLISGTAPIGCHPSGCHPAP